MSETSKEIKDYGKVLTDRLDELIYHTRIQHVTLEEEGRFLSFHGLADKERLESRIETLGEIRRWFL
jgi:hypothetical protein